jgi:hypothetical protein
MTPIKAAIAAVFISTAANATDVVKLASPNDMNGHVILTNQPCDLQINFPVTEKLFYAYATIEEETAQEKRVEGCWFQSNPDQSQIPEDKIKYAVPVVNILTPEGVVYSQPLSNFKPYRRETF